MFEALHGPDPGAIAPLDNTALNNVNSDPSFVEADDVPDPRPLQVNAADGAGPLAAGVDVGNLDLGYGEPAAGTMFKGWKYRDYTDTAGDAVRDGNKGTTGTNRARVYSSRTPPAKKRPEDHFTSNRPTARMETYVAATRTVTPDSSAQISITSPSFPPAGTSIFREFTLSGEQVKVPGTYDGAPGHYLCTPSSNEQCSAGRFLDRGEPGITLSAGWSFVHDEGAMVDVLDNDYYYFGWWVREDSDDMPVAASAFWNVSDLNPVSSANQLTGRASYAGLAAGLYGIKPTLLNAGEMSGSGDFTADVELNARFGTASEQGDVTGTIDNFRLNGGDADPGWSVTLEQTSWIAGGRTNTAAVNNTSWTIGGIKAPKSGNWELTAYDHATSDGKMIPTDVGGTFYTEFGSTHRMVGAFSATLQE